MEHYHLLVDSFDGIRVREFHGPNAFNLMHSHLCGYLGQTPEQLVRHNFGLNNWALQDILKDAESWTTTVTLYQGKPFQNTVKITAAKGPAPRPDLRTAIGSMLDEIGNRARTPRVMDESDDSYRKRIIEGLPQPRIDPAGVPILRPTTLETFAAGTMNLIQAWMDGGPGLPFPEDAKDNIRAFLQVYEMRRKA